MKTLFLVLTLFATSFSINSNAQQATPGLLNDSISIKKPAKDSTAKKKFSPRIAALRSAILPGWGQIYNKKYWKLPIVYGALGVSGGIFFYNLKNYKDTRFAYRVKYNMRVFQKDSSLYSQIRDELKPLSEESLRFYRNEFRRDIDYSALIFLLLWGLNVVDATVDAHLKSFDVSPDLTLNIKPGYSEMAGTNGLSLVLNIH
ncbi:MAG: hypothetical protein JST10_03045 [Bacteroidetes bacterium]|nr:hypothetical protein [Bacteroidota bacterium]MBS1631530.1 hypothetical protein [Bacteroidota bacterium]